jgi:MFS family permease
MPERHDRLAALRQSQFQLYAGGRLASATAMTLLNATIFYQVFKISDSAFQLGMIGLARFLPSLGLSLVGGALADARDRRRIAMVAQVVPLLASSALLVLTSSERIELAYIYALVLVVACAAAFENPARQALLPLLVKPETFPNAIVVSSTVQSLGFVTGPALAGGLIYLGGFSLAYAVHAGLVALSIGSFFLLRPRAAEGARSTVDLAAVREGVNFVLHRQVVLGAMTLDMFAVVFGGAVALLPIYAEDILNVGPLGYGLLAASLDVGALSMSVLLVLIPPIRRVGPTLLLTVAAFGILTIAFGLSRSFALSVGIYMLIGMADQISVVMRQTTIQLSVPDELRGRVSSVNMLFIGASNQLGAVESGVVAALTNATFAVVSGGAGCLAVVAAVAAKMPDLRGYTVPPASDEPNRWRSPPAPTNAPQPSRHLLRRADDALLVARDRWEGGLEDRCPRRGRGLRWCGGLRWRGRGCGQRSEEHARVGDVDDDAPVPDRVRVVRVEDVHVERRYAHPAAHADLLGRRPHRDGP